MKKSFSIFFVFVILICFIASCKGRSIYTMERDAEIEALEEKYREGISEAQEHIASLVEVDMWDLEFDIKDKWGMYPASAIQILTDYADGEPVSKSEVNKAIWAIRQYYYGTYDIINDIDNYWID